MDQQKIGKFIAKSRNEKGFTQKDLGEQIGVSDRTISKWECGKSMPDLSYMDSLCQSLEVSMNELISGERLSESIYSDKAEENIMNLMKENVASEKKIKYGSIAGCAIILASLLLLLYLTSGGIGGAAKFLDVSVFLFLLLFQLAIVFIVRPRDKKALLNLMSKISIPCGGFISLFYIATLLYNLSNLHGIGPNLMVGILPMIYVIVEYVVVITLREKTKTN